MDDISMTLMARGLRLSIVQQLYDCHELTLEEAREILSGPLDPDDPNTVVDDSDQIVEHKDG